MKPRTTDDMKQDLYDAASWLSNKSLGRYLVSNFQVLVAEGKPAEDAYEIVSLSIDRALTQEIDEEKAQFKYEKEQLEKRRRDAAKSNNDFKQACRIDISAFVK